MSDPSLPAYTLLMPLYGHTEFADLALKSILRHSARVSPLILSVEPVNTAEDENWLSKVSSWWPCPVHIIRNDRQLGYYASVNRMVRECKTDIAILFTSDQVAAPNWDAEMLRHLQYRRFVTGRLVESGAVVIADGNIWKNFGIRPEEFREKDFVEFCSQYRPSRELDIPRHYIPMAFHVEDFRGAGGFEEETFREDFYFFMRCCDAGYQLVEVQKPLTYHFQGGSRKRFLRDRLLNWLYPFGGKYLHRMITGYVSLYDALRAKGLTPPSPDATDGQ